MEDDKTTKTNTPSIEESIKDIETKDKPTKTPPAKAKKLRGILYWVLLVALLAIDTSCIYIWQHRKVENLTKQVSQLTSEVQSWNNAGSSSYSPAQLSALTNKELAYGIQTTTALQLGIGKATVQSALFASSFGGDTFSNGEGAIAEINLTNNTKTEQSYNLADFSFQLPDGEIVPVAYTYQSEQTMTPTLAPGGALTEIIEANIDPSSAAVGNGELIYFPYGSGSSTTYNGSLTTGSSTAGSSTTGSSTTGGSNTTNSGIIEAALSFKKTYN